MNDEDIIETHYTHGDLLKTLELVFNELGQMPDSVTMEQLAAIDEFHIGGRQATTHLIEQVQFADQVKLLDIGCGLGGTTRYLASHYDSQVIGIDLTAEYLNVGKLFNQNLGLTDKINLLQASALSLPFAEQTVDGVTMLHVGMNIEDKQKLFSEVFRCLRKKSYFLIYDVMQSNEGEIFYPLPWSSTAKNSYLASIETYQKALIEAGFEIHKINNRREFSINYFNQQAEVIKADRVKPTLSLQTLIRDDAKSKFSNLIQQIKSNVLAPVEIIAIKPN